MLIQIPSEPKNLCSHTRFSINQWSRLVRLLEETLQQSSNHARAEWYQEPRAEGQRFDWTVIRPVCFDDGSQEPTQHKASVNRVSFQEEKRLEYGSTVKPPVNKNRNSVSFIVSISKNKDVLSPQHFGR